MTERANTIERSHLWESIYSIVSQIPRAEVEGDALDAPSAATAIESMVVDYYGQTDIQNESLIDLYNGTSTDDGTGEIETQTAWLERQLLNRI